MSEDLVKYVESIEEFEQIAGETDGIVSQARTLRIGGEKTAYRAASLLSEISTNVKLLEEQRVFLVKPLQDHVKKINDHVAGLKRPLENADSILRGKLTTYNVEHDAPQTLRGDGFTVSRVGRDEVVIDDVKKIPREYLKVDEAKIKKALQAGKTVKGAHLVKSEGVRVINE